MNDLCAKNPKAAQKFLKDKGDVEVGTALFAA